MIAELSTSAGVRAPLAHLADQVFLSLSREIEAQGVARKVVADMFGLALRGYQKKTQRLAQSASTQGKTLFEAVLEYIEVEGGASRAAVLKRFHYDGERETIGVLADLTASGLAYATGSGDNTLYGITSDAERQRLTRETDAQALANMALGEIYRAPGITQEALANRLGTPRAELSAALDTLAQEGRVSFDSASGALRASTFQIAPDAQVGWESAVFDHFQAVATAITNKLRLRARAHAAADLVGGTTLRFELSRNHPHRNEVLGLLEETRKRAQGLWQTVGEYNDEHPLREDERVMVSFYFGQKNPIHSWQRNLMMTNRALPRPETQNPMDDSRTPLKRDAYWGAALCAFLVAVMSLNGCGTQTGDVGNGSNTSWLSTCSDDESCEGGVCVYGVCTPVLRRG